VVHVYKTKMSFARIVRSCLGTPREGFLYHAQTLSVLVQNMAMTLDALIERTVRQGMQREGLEDLPILPEGRPTRTPTTARLLEMSATSRGTSSNEEGRRLRFRYSSSHYRNNSSVSSSTWTRQPTADRIPAEVCKAVKISDEMEGASPGPTSVESSCLR
jgi:hypothetical protein